MNNIRKELIALAEESYREFSAKLVPGVDNILGVRLPTLRKMAKKLACGQFEPFLAEDELLFFEEVMLQGMVIGYLNLEWSEKEPYVARYVPKINNWSLCDSFCNGLKFKEKERDTVWYFLQSYLQSDNPYDIRFAVVMLLSYFVNEEYAPKAFAAFDSINHDNYYVKMGVAWAISIYFRDLPEVTLPYLQQNKLDKWTYNKALQKIRESRKSRRFWQTTELRI